ncbi:hypothetical protein LCGC14_0264340 [marine sediment metagenome]|uniref:Uncharacterized protein n=1 Tax=marine sediment metagenome TaxID=412755 RepID=A0A0F9UHQ4_9ZZZZ
MPSFLGDGEEWKCSRASVGLWRRTSRRVAKAEDRVKQLEYWRQLDTKRVKRLMVELTQEREGHSMSRLFNEVYEAKGVDEDQTLEDLVNEIKRLEDEAVVAGVNEQILATIQDKDQCRYRLKYDGGIFWCLLDEGHKNDEHKYDLPVHIELPVTFETFIEGETDD